MTTVSSQFAIGMPMGRSVWILNRHKEQTYKQEFQGHLVEVPPNEERSVHMDYLDAEAFLSQPDRPQDFDNAGREVYMGKPLYIAEMTDEERGKYDPRYKEKAKETEVMMDFACTICGKKLNTEKGLFLHTKRTHPDMEPVTEE